MLDVCLLGTGGTMPLPERWLTSLLLRWEGKELLVDCGEGTQIALHKEGLSCRHIDTILLTHYHADHTTGLPGLFLSMAKADRTEPVTVIGPKGIDNLLKGVILMARYVPFDIRYMELKEKEVSFDIDDLHINAFMVKHSVPCYGYEFNLARKPRFDREKAIRSNVPLKVWSLLQKGETAEIDGHVYTPDMVLGESRKGIKLVYSTDTRPCESLKTHAQNADLLITEGMYGNMEKLEKAKLNKHMMMQEAAELAAGADVKELWYTHYSPSEGSPQRYADEVHAIFPRALIAEDGQRKELSFESE